MTSKIGYFHHIEFLAGTSYALFTWPHLGNREGWLDFLFTFRNSVYMWAHVCFWNHWHTHLWVCSDDISILMCFEPKLTFCPIPSQWQNADGNRYTSNLYVPQNTNNSKTSQSLRLDPQQKLVTLSCLARFSSIEPMLNMLGNWNHCISTSFRLRHMILGSHWREKLQHYDVPCLHAVNSVIAATVAILHFWPIVWHRDGMYIER